MFYFDGPTEAEVKVDAEIAAAQAAFKAGLQISQIEPWRDRVARCCPAVQKMMEIESLLAVDDEESEQEFEGSVRGFCSEEQKELRMRIYEEQVAVGEIQFIPSTEVL